jgi:hypothetical protein
MIYQVYTARSGWDPRMNVSLATKHFFSSLFFIFFTFMYGTGHVRVRGKPHKKYDPYEIALTSSSVLSKG